ncbi:proline racemase family protein [Streptomyces lanatus]|uniref:Proline racemase family protein n=1 Tax=Streptomyces lanatus TaxID=66900 RepID=A0ABV1XQ62_9ACTN|nr:proline racemase family protein [Streptomyces lanatus]GHG88401.1 hypothetical protein GCM10018780_06860 [Streptomyces lanatus]
MRAQHLFQCVDSHTAGNPTRTVLLETGQVPALEPETHLRFDTPAGLVDVTVEVSDGRVGLVRFLSPPSFLLHEGVEVTLPGHSPVTADIAYGGNFIAGRAHLTATSTQLLDPDDPPPLSASLARRAPIGTGSWSPDALGRQQPYSTL